MKKNILTASLMFFALSKSCYAMDNECPMNFTLHNLSGHSVKFAYADSSSPGDEPGDSKYGSTSSFVSLKPGAAMSLGTGDCWGNDCGILQVFVDDIAYSGLWPVSKQPAFTVIKQTHNTDGSYVWWLQTNQPSQIHDGSNDYFLSGDYGNIPSTRDDFRADDFPFSCSEDQSLGPINIYYRSVAVTQ